ncbi:DUF317 domain-containing protein, partial [Kitasatospora sp. NPDC001574]
HHDRHLPPSRLPAGPRRAPGSNTVDGQPACHIAPIPAGPRPVNGIVLQETPLTDPAPDQFSPRRALNASREYHVAPRHLAPGAGVPDTALQRLASAQWLYGGDDVANVYLASPDLRIRFGFLPEVPGPLWKATAGDPFHGDAAWLVTMSDQTPAEIVADFASALVRVHAEGPAAYLTDARPVAFDATLVAAGWNTVEDERLPYPFSQSPDGYAEVHHVPGDLDRAGELSGASARWIVNGGTEEERWWVTASSGTPTRVVADLYGAVVSPAPVRREGSDLRHLPPCATITPVTPVRGSSRALAAYAGSALIRSAHPSISVPAPAVAPTADRSTVAQQQPSGRTR